jgi:TRAP-type C4-dicarboxylate transport system permease small subunit
MQKKSISELWKSLCSITSVIEKIGSYVLIAMMLLTVSDLILRRFFNSPLPFSFELVEFLLVVVAYCYIPYVPSTGRHVSVDTLTSRLPRSTRDKIVIGGDFVTAIVFGLISWQNVLQGFNVMNLGATTAILHVPKFPFQFWVAFGSGVACIAVLVKTLNSIAGETK